MSYIISQPWGGHCGIGHQFQNWLVGHILSNRYGLTHVHAPFCGDIIESQIDVPVEKWDSFLGFGIHMPEHTKTLQSVDKIIVLPKIEWDESDWETVTCERQEWKSIIESEKDNNVLFMCSRDQFVGLGWEYVNHEDLRFKYNTARRYWPVEPDRTDGKTNVAIHIRRGDVTESGKYKVRWVSNSVYANVMNQIRELGIDPVFRIYSDGSHDQFQDLMAPDVKVLTQNHGVFKTFHSMVSADILMPGQSAFSVLAGHLCGGMILGRGWSPIWDNFPEDKRFVVVDKEGNLQNDLV